MCTHFSIKADDGHVVAARSMENAAQHLNSQLFFGSEGETQDQQACTQKLIENSNGELSPSDLTPNVDYCTWQVKYDFVAMNGFGLDCAVHGMNSQGLSVGSMTLVGSGYQASSGANVGSNVNIIQFPYLPSYLLGQCDTCQDVINTLDKLRVVSPFLSNVTSKLQQQGMMFHYPVTDAKGNSIVIEYVNTTCNVYDNSIGSGAPSLEATGLSQVNFISDLAHKTGVLTNDPELSWQAINLTNYVNLSPTNAPEGIAGYPSPNALTAAQQQAGHNFINISVSQGTGNIGLPGSSTPVDRFVKTALLTNWADRAKDGHAAMNLAYHILNTVDIPKGMSASNTESNSKEQDYTQWLMVSDLTKKMVTIRTYDSPMVYSIDFSDPQAAIEALGPHKSIPINQFSISLYSNNALAKVS